MGLQHAKVVLAGGTGLVGRSLARDLCEAGARVVVLSRRPDRFPAAPGIEFHPWENLPILLGDCLAVVNLAGENIGARRWTAERKRELQDSRIQATRALVAALAVADPRPRVLVNASAVGLFGDRPGIDCDESTAAGKGFLADLCRAWEAEASAAEAVGARVVLLRLGVVLAREGGALPRMAGLVRRYLGAPVGGGMQAVSWIHLADAARMILAAIEDPAWSGPVHATAPEPTTQRVLLAMLARRLGRPLWPAPAAVSAFGATILLGEMAGPLLLEGARVIPRKAMERGFAFRFPTLAAALEDLFPAGRPISS